MVDGEISIMTYEILSIIRKTKRFGGANTLTNNNLYIVLYMFILLGDFVCQNRSVKGLQLYVYATGITFAFRLINRNSY